MKQFRIALLLVFAIGGARVFARARGFDRVAVDFAQPRSLEEVQLFGFSHQEEAGRWTDGKRATIHTKAIFPSRVRVMLTARAFAPQKPQVVNICLGFQCRPLTVDGESHKYTIDFDAASGASSLQLEMDEALSPSTVGMNDGRLLGVFVQQLVIERPS